MPDHVHLILKVKTPLTVSRFMRRFKDFTAHEIGIGPIREKGCWSEVITSGTMFFEKLRYIHQNPVKAQLVSRETDFEWSSARDYLLTSEMPRVERFDA